MAKVTLITRDAELATFCSHAARAQWLAVDTEFIREKTYFPQLCLVQIGAAGRVACIDPLAELNLEPIRALFADANIVKVLHAAEQDLELFNLHFNELPTPLFDTQMAATLLGYGDQIGYANLVKRVLNVDLRKGQTRTDWSLRPLSGEQLSYAADDVRYLDQLYPPLLAELVQRDRLQWLADDFARLADPARFAPHPDSAWRRVKAAGKLTGQRLLALQHLARWREERAIAADKPRRWIIADDTLLAIAQLLPADRDALARLRGLNESTLRRHGEELVAIVAVALAAPPDTWPVNEHSGARLGIEAEAQVDVLLGLLKLSAAEHQISPAALANRRDLEGLIEGKSGPLLEGWRAAVAGDRLRQWLAGNQVLRVIDGKLALASNGSQ